MRGEQSGQSLSPAHSTGLRAEERPPLWARARPSLCTVMVWGLRKDGLGTLAEMGAKEPQSGDRGGPRSSKARALSGGAPCQPQKEELSVRAARVTIYWVQNTSSRSASASSDLQSHPAMEVLPNSSYSCFPDEDWGLRKVTSTQNHEAAK